MNDATVPDLIDQGDAQSNYDAEGFLASPGVLGEAGFFSSPGGDFFGVSPGLAGASAGLFASPGFETAGSSFFSVGTALAGVVSLALVGVDIFLSSTSAGFVLSFFLSSPGFVGMGAVVLGALVLSRLRLPPPSSSN